MRNYDDILKFAQDCESFEKLCGLSPIAAIEYLENNPEFTKRYYEGFKKIDANCDNPFLEIMERIIVLNEMTKKFQ